MVSASIHCKLWKSMARLLLPLLLAVVSQVAAFEDGAPNHRCSNLVPMHGTNGPQATQPPFELVISPQQYTPGGSVQVTLRGVSGNKFKGFAIAAHRLTGDTEELVGGFEVTGDARGGFWYSSSSSVPNCITHQLPIDKSEVTFKWLAPVKSVGSVAFTTPVVQHFTRYWANVTSGVVTANAPSEDPPFPPLNIGGSPSPLSGSCGTDYGCVRSPALCNVPSCEVYIKFLYLEAEGRLKFQLEATGNYISLGLSDDDKMQDDLTLTCTSVSEFSMQLGYNPTYSYLNERHRWTPLGEKYIEQLDGNRIKCEFTIPLSVNFTTYPIPRQGIAPAVMRSFDLRSPRFAFVAYGNTYSGSSSVSKHSELPAISESKVDLLSRGSYSAHRISGLRRAHGGIMLLCWQILVPLAANMALFYRSLFMKSFGGIQLWFHLHRVFALSAFGLTIVGVLLIFAQFGWKWSFTYVTTQTHGAMGLTVVCLAAIQILMGMLRPDKDAPRRPLFKMLHQGVAYSALGLADGTIITIGFLQTLPLSYRTSHTVFAFTWLVFHVSFRIGMSILQARWSNRNVAAIDNAKAYEELENERFKMMRLLFGVFLIGMLIIFFCWFIILMLF